MSEDKLREIEEAANRLEAALRSLIGGEFSSLTVSFNDSNAPNYMTVAAWDDEQFEHDPAEWVSDEERQKARAANSCWGVHWYPNTPVGFNAVQASTLAAAIVGALKYEP